MRPAEVFYDGMLADPRLDHPEGIAVHPDGSIWCGGERGQIFRISPDGAAMEQVAELDGFCLGLAFDSGARNLFVCDMAQRAVVRLDLTTGAATQFAAGFEVPNHLCFDGRGRLYVSDSLGQGRSGPALHRFEPDGSGGLWTDAPFDFANGLALAPDGSALYVAESWGRRVRRVPISASGAAGTPELVAELDGTLPDGLAFAADGGLYVALYQPSRIVRIEPGGDVTVVADDPDAHLLAHPTNLAFRGRELFAANFGRWHVTRIDAAVNGVPLPVGGAP